MHPAPVSQGQIIYHPSIVKVKLFMGRSDPSCVIGKPPGPRCTDKLSCRLGDALAEGPVNKAVSAVCVVRCTARRPERRAVNPPSSVSWAGFYCLYAWRCAPVLPVISASVQDSQIISVPVFWDCKQLLPNSEHMFEPLNSCSYPSCSFC